MAAPGYSIKSFGRNGVSITIRLSGYIGKKSFLFAGNGGKRFVVWPGKNLIL